jgi:hypothetical protein
MLTAYSCFGVSQNPAIVAPRMSSTPKSTGTPTGVSTDGDATIDRTLVVQMLVECQVSEDFAREDFGVTARVTRPSTTYYHSALPFQLSRSRSGPTHTVSRGRLFPTRFAPTLTPS